MGCGPKQVLECDASPGDVLALVAFPPAGCMLSLPAVECARWVHHAAPCNPTSPLKPGSHPATAVTLRLLFYMLGKREFSYVQKRRWSRLPWTLSLTPSSFRAVPRPTLSPANTGVCFLVARKNPGAMSQECQPEVWPDLEASARLYAREALGMGSVSRALLSTLTFHLLKL